MANVDIKDLEFRKPNEEELKEIKKNISIHNRKVFLVRFLILLAVLIVVLVIQYFGQFSLVQDYSWKAFFSRQTLFYIIFIVLNVFSAIPLIYARVTAKSLEFRKFKVLKKMKVKEKHVSGDASTGDQGFIFSSYVKSKYLMVEDFETGENVVGKVFIDGPMEYSSVKEGDEIIAEKAEYKDHYRYYYVTALYTRR